LIGTLPIITSIPFFISANHNKKISISLQKTSLHLPNQNINESFGFSLNIGL
jgi:hypothetical protein